MENEKEYFPRAAFELGEMVTTDLEKAKVKTGRIIGVEWGPNLRQEEAKIRGYDYPVTGSGWVYHVKRRGEETGWTSIIPEKHLKKES